MTQKEVAPAPRSNAARGEILSHSGFNPNGVRTS